MLQYADLNTEKHGENAECRRVIGVLAFIGYGRDLFRFHVLARVLQTNAVIFLRSAEIPALDSTVRSRLASVITSQS